MTEAMPWTKATLWPEEREGSWVWQWDKYGEPEPTKVWVPIGLKRDKKNCWGKWFASLDFDVAASQKLLPTLDDLQFINFHGGDFLIIHFSAQGMLMYPQLIEKVMSTRVSIPDNIAILTFATDNIARQALLLKQLDRYGIGYRNLAHHVLPSGQEWRHFYKFHGLVDVLPKIEQDYALILDGIDVLLFQPLDSIIERFNAYGKEIVFGAQRPRWPKVDLPGEDDNEYGEYRYLNSGTVFGRTQALASFFKRAWDVQKENKIHNDQLPCRMVFCERRDSVELDHRRSLFQNVGLIRYDGGDCLKFW